MQLDGRTALVTGGCVRVGRAIAVALASKGARVALHYFSSADAAHAVADEIRALGSSCVLVQADLARPEAPARLVRTSVEALDGLDILINNAAIFPEGGWQDTTLQVWDEVFAINLRAPFFLAQAFGLSLTGDARGHIINVADWRALRPGVGHTAYTLAKAGLVAMTYSLAQSMAPAVQVNAVAPGAVLPPPGGDQSYLDKLAAQVPLKRYGSPLDVAQAVVYLLESDFVTGEVLHITGGQQL
ncbi:MAG: SDR family oxidoreductase [Chloroflexi bacterium]|mgnify:CR=1 FL=1|nr:SDR family oxidoreductase [Chloroflexota bacterium]